MSSGPKRITIEDLLALRSVPISLTKPANFNEICEEIRKSTSEIEAESSLMSLQREESSTGNSSGTTSWNLVREVKSSKNKRGSTETPDKINISSNFKSSGKKNPNSNPHAVDVVAPVKTTRANFALLALDDDNDNNDEESEQSEDDE